MRYAVHATEPRAYAVEPPERCSRCLRRTWGQPCEGCGLAALITSQPIDKPLTGRMPSLRPWEAR